ncbi:hypothetical protein LPJ61_006367, partial [Coemansia biformis]
ALNKDWRHDAQVTYLELIGRIFKGNENLERGLLMGVHEFKLSDMDSGANNIRNILLTTRGYSHNAASPEGPAVRMTGIGLFTELFAFSGTEVVELVRWVLGRFSNAIRYAENEIVDILTKWYDGYDFGLVGRRYNPISVLGFLESLVTGSRQIATRSYWLDTGNPYSTEQLARTYRSATLLLASRLIDDYDSEGTNCSVRVKGMGGASGIDVHEIGLGSSSYPDDMGHLYGTSNLVTFLIHLGYLTRGDNNAVRIPNMELRTEWDMLSRVAAIRSGEVTGIDTDREDLWNHLYSGDARDVKYDIISVQGEWANAANHYHEKEYADIIRSCLKIRLRKPRNPDTDPKFDAQLATEVETGQGKLDTVITFDKGPETTDKLVVFIEFKHINPAYHTADDSPLERALTGLAQIVDREYSRHYRSDDYQRRLDIGVALNSAQCEVVWRKWIPTNTTNDDNDASAAAAAAYNHKRKGR